MAWKNAVRNPCILCEKEEGSIETADGLVCNSCMPIELIDRAESLQKHSIIIFKKTHPGWIPCSSLNRQEGSVRPAEDRSMMITNNSKVSFLDELLYQIPKADSIDIVVSFIMLSGLDLILSKLREFTKHGRLRVITTAYFATTEYEAIRQLMTLDNTEVRMELDADESRLHAKAFIFRKEGHTVAYVGSANLSKTALTSGEEWVVKLKEEEVPDIVRDVNIGFESIWNSISYRRITKHNLSAVETALGK